MTARLGPGTAGRVGMIAIAAEVVALLVIWLTVSRQMHIEQTDAALREAERLCAALAPRYGAAIRDDNLGALVEMTQTDAARLGARVVIVSEDGAIAAESHAGDAPDGDVIRGRQAVAQAFVRSTATALAGDDALGGEAAQAARLVSAPPRRIVLGVSLLAPEITDARRSALRAIAPIGVAAVLLTGIIALMIRSQAARDLEAVTSDARAIEKGDRTRRFRIARTPEYAAAVDALNALTSRLVSDIHRHRMRSRRRRAVIRSMPGAVLALDNEQRILSVNKVGEQMLGIRETKARGRLLQECTRQPGLNQFVEDAFASDGRYEDEFELDVPEQVIVQAASRPLRNPSDEVIGRVVVLQDVTRLRRLERVRRDFAANVSHELRTPITNIRGYIETVQDSAHEFPESTRKHLEVIARNADRLWLIVEDMLELARLEDPEARRSLVFSPTPVAELIRLAIEQARERASSRGVSLEADCSDDLTVRVSPRLIGQALNNLLSNAIRHSPEGGVVRVTASEIGGEDEGGAARMVEIGVEDKGPGVEKKHLPRLFERFYRVDPSRSRAEGGTGLGLAIVKHVARLHGGREGVESILGKGSRFWIRLPAGRDDSGA